MRNWEGISSCDEEELVRKGRRYADCGGVGREVDIERGGTVKVVDVRRRELGKEVDVERREVEKEAVVEK